jgi:hypothetical protein
MLAAEGSFDTSWVDKILTEELVPKLYDGAIAIDI